MSSTNQHSGTTPTERLLFKLCRHSFLQLWSYANVFRDQGKKGVGDGKELCDILVVFGNSVILFSDKSCNFPTTGNVEVNWSRWYRRAVIGSQRQLSGAERWIRQFPDRVFVDRRCTQPLNVSLPSPAHIQFYKVCVALGAADPCRSFFKCGSGSLMLTEPASKLEIPGGDNIPTPFTVGMSYGPEIIHIVNEVTLPILLNQLNTVSDFVDYLKTKERLVRSGKAISIKGEEDLVGLFLGAGTSLPDALDAQVGINSVTIDDGIYEDILKRKDYLGYTSENQSSYFWDWLIEYHTHCVFNGTLVKGSVVTVAENEELLRILASESRVRRRVLSDAYLDLIASAPRNQISSRTLKIPGDTLYVFQVHPRSDSDEKDYRKYRQEYLHQYCLLTAWRNRDKCQIVGLVTDGPHPMKDGYDIIKLELGEWTPDMVKMGEELERDMANDVVKPLTLRPLDAKFLKAWGSKESAG